MNVRVAWVFGVMALGVGCSSDGDDGGAGSCGVQLAGQYYSYGECLHNLGCEVAQRGCSFTMTCEDGEVFAGEVDAGGSVDFGNDGTSCFGQFNPSDKGLTLTCDPIYGQPGTAQCGSFVFECEDGGSCMTGG